MDINCFNCHNKCCSCQGCTPQYVAGNWYCPRCAPGIQVQATAVQQPVAQNLYQITPADPRTYQLITNHMRKR